MIGKTISHYKIIEKMGEGGMGVVYKAQDTKLKRTVALKFLPPELTRNKEAKERFIHEAQAASALEHNNICNIHAVDETSEGQMFIAMACYDGETLKERIKRGPMKLEEAIRIVCQIGEGLQEAHRKEIVHRDIKPANIVITSRGQVKIMDFGVAKLLGKTKLTQTGTTLGTVAYMSPEQAQGKDVDHRSDIWSLGVILFEMITGRQPFQGDYEQAVVYSILNDQPESVTGLRTGVPMALEQVITKALHKDPKKRYQHVDDMLVDLKNMKSPDASAIQESGKGRRSGVIKWTLIGGSISAMALILIFVLVILPLFKSNPYMKSENPKIVVLPYENLGPPEQAYFADGMTEEITSRLAAYPELGVISRTSAYQYQNLNIPVPKIGEELNVDYVLEGSVRWDQSGGTYGRVRVTNKLIRVADDTHIWAESYERQLEDIFQVQSEIAGQVIRQMNIQLLDKGKGPPIRLTDNIEAYQAYLRGLDYTGRKAYSKEDRLIQIEMLERAVSLDPDFALAYAQLSMVHSRMVMYGMDTSPQRAKNAKQTLDRAAELNPDLPEVHIARGYYQYWCFRDYENALMAFQIAAEKLPNDGRILGALGYIIRRQGHWKKSLEYLLRAFELNPKSSEQAREIGVNYIAIRDYKMARTYFNRSIALAPDQQAAYVFKAMSYWMEKDSLPLARQVLESMPKVNNWFYYYFWFLQELYERNYEKALDLLVLIPTDVLESPDEYRPKSIALGLVYWCMGDTTRSRLAYEQARRVLEEKLIDLPSDFRVHAALGKVYAQLGLKERAIERAEHAVALLPIAKDAMHGPSVLRDLIEVYIQVGEADMALDQIEILFAVDCPISPVLFYNDPMLVKITNHPRFKKLEKKFKR